MNQTKGFLTALSLSGVFLLSACSGGAGGGDIYTTPTTPPSNNGTGIASAFTCPSSSSSLNAIGTGSASSQSRHVYPNTAMPQSASNTLAVTYDASQSSNVESEIDRRVAGFGARKLSALSFDRTGKVVRLVQSDAAHIASVKSALASVPGVSNVSETRRLFAKTVNPNITNDPYFKGSSGTVAPLYQNANSAGQWDMHVVGMEYAFGYSTGSTSVRLAIIDTGADVSHPDLAAANVVRTRCYITDTNNVQSVGNFVTDPDGHGTDVTGIAGASINNGFGFVGTGGNISLMLYRVFPTPDDSCNSATSTSAQCGAADTDVASAINDAVANGANVISLSLGGTACSNGIDPSSVEGNAVANAIANNVIVVAASGNESNSAVDSPACDAGVIAVGASSYNDGQPNGSGFTGASTEYVASYSNDGSTNALRSATSWGLVAPGGDPTAGTATTSDNDNLHWIENIWTSTPFDSTFAGFCNTDAFGEANDCRVLIAGTSMSTPHVAGAAALILSKSGAYRSAVAMKQLLCQSADSVNDARQGCGRLNVYRAMAIASGDPNVP